MAAIQNNYQIFKLPASRIASAPGLDVGKYTKTQGFRDDCIVSIGDNLVFRQIRAMNGDGRSHVEIFNTVRRYRERQHEYKREGKYKEAHILDMVISSVLFVKEVVNVVVDGRKSDFDKFRVKGFTLNGTHYVYLCSGAGQIRRNTATFIDEAYRDEVVRTLDCGFKEKAKEYVLAKYTAYFALAFSSVYWVRTPRVCVVPDYFRTLKGVKVDFISKDADGRASIAEREMDLELNCADGQGLIDPGFAELWAEDIGLPYVPCSFVARSCFVKGNLVAFDFREYARTHGIDRVRDIWGAERDVDQIDVILSESQFKTHALYSSWEEYLSYAEAGKVAWGVARYAKDADDECVLANYQYIQALTLTKEEIHELVRPTVEWIRSICSGDPLFTLLYMFGPKDSAPDGLGPMFGAAQTDAMRAVVKNAAFLKDPYVQRKVYKSIAEAIDRAKIGKVWIRGNYQFMISDPLAQCQAALGLEPVGALRADEVWCDFWRSRGVGLVDLCRSPMIDQHEHNPCRVVNGDEDANYWFRHIRSGVVYNTYDTSCARHSDSDFDGDIVLSTDNALFIKGSHKDHNIITYEKGSAKKEAPTVANITKTVKKGFGSGVGGFSNTATILYAMAAIFDRPGHEDQRAEVMRRIKLLREIVGQEIDRIKGADKPSLPHEWKEYDEPSPDDDEATRAAKYRRNAMVVSKKPYFFRYLYKESNRQHKEFEAAYDRVCRDQFGGLRFKRLLRMEDKTPEQRDLVRKYQKYAPLITSQCTMNVLCRDVESADFDIRFDKSGSGASMLPTFEDAYASSFDPAKLAAVEAMYRRYNGRRSAKRLDAIIRDGDIAAQLGDDYEELRSDLISMDIRDLQSELAASGMQGEEFLFYCHRLSLSRASFNWGFAWDLLEDQITKLVPFGRSLCPVVDENGHEYLGRRYSLIDVTDRTESAIQKLLAAVFGYDPWSRPREPDGLDEEVAAYMAKGGCADGE